MPGFRMTGPGAGCPRSLHRRLYLASFRFTLTPSWGQNGFKIKKMKLPEAPGALPAFCKDLELPQKKKIKKWAVSMKAPAGTIGHPGIPGQ